MPQELFPKVELWQLSEHVTQALKEIVRDALVEHSTVERSPVGGMRAAEASAYIGIGRSTFYKLIKTEAHLQHSYVVGTARMWRKEDLDAWMQAQVESNQIHPEIKLSTSSKSRNDEIRLGWAGLHPQTRVHAPIRPSIPFS